MVYPTTKLGILYRPSTKKIIKAGPVAFAQQVSTVLYGAKADRDTAAGILKKAFAATVSIAGQSDAKAAIASTVVVDVSGKNGELAGQLAAELKGKVGSVPEGQDIPPSGVGIAIFDAPTTTTGDGTSTAPTNP